MNKFNLEKYMLPYHMNKDYEKLLLDKYKDFEGTAKEFMELDDEYGYERAMLVFQGFNEKEVDLWQHPIARRIGETVHVMFAPIFNEKFPEKAVPLDIEEIRAREYMGYDYLEFLLDLSNKGLIPVEELPEFEESIVSLVKELIEEEG